MRCCSSPLNGNAVNLARWTARRRLLWGQMSDVCVGRVRSFWWDLKDPKRGVVWLIHIQRAAVFTFDTLVWMVAELVVFAVFMVEMEGY